MLRNNRIMREYRDILNNPCEYALIVQDTDNILNWYCLIRKIEEYPEGEYIFNITLPKDYPFTGPDFVILTPNGRFEINKQICFSNSSFHPETWSPLWNINMMVTGFVSMFRESTSTGIGHMNYDATVCNKYALNSHSFNMTNYPKIMELFVATYPSILQT